MVFNDCITRAAFARGLSLIDLRLICDRDEDFANPIEPSIRGGAKIAAAITALVTDVPARVRTAPDKGLFPGGQHGSRTPSVAIVPAP